jgi:hypothetical protein
MRGFVFERRVRRARIAHRDRRRKLRDQFVGPTHNCVRIVDDGRNKKQPCCEQGRQRRIAAEADHRFRFQFQEQKNRAQRTDA